MPMSPPGDVTLLPDFLGHGLLGLLGVLRDLTRSTGTASLNALADDARLLMPRGNLSTRSISASRQHRLSQSQRAY